MICFEVDGLEIARGNTEQEILNSNVLIFDTEPKSVPLRTVINNNPVYITQDIFDFISKFEYNQENLKEFERIKSTLPSIFVAQVQSMSEIQVPEIDIEVTDEEIDTEILESTPKEEPIKEVNKKNFTAVKPLGFLTGTDLDFRVSDTEYNENPILQFINHVIYNNKKNLFKGDLNFKLFTAKELTELKSKGIYDYVWKKSDDTAEQIKTMPENTPEEKAEKEKAIKFVKDNWGYDKLSNDNGLNLVLVDDDGNPKTVKLNDLNYIVRFGLNGKIKEQELVDGKADKSNTYTIRPIIESKGKPVLHSNKEYERFTVDYLRTQNIRIQIGKKERGGAYPGTVFFNHNMNNQFRVQIDFNEIKVQDYIIIFDRIKELKKRFKDKLDKGIISQKDYNREVNERIPIAWNRLVRHDKQLKDVEEESQYKRTSFYPDYMSPLGKQIVNPVNGSVYKEGHFILLSKDGNKRLFFNDDVFIIIENGVFNVVTKEKAAKAIYDFSNAQLVKKKRKFSPPIQSTVSEKERGASYAPLDLNTYLDILGINPQGDEITPLDMVSKLGRSRVKYDGNNPAIYNQKFEIVQAVTNIRNIPVQEELKEVVNVEIPVEVIKKNKNKKVRKSGENSTGDIERNVNLEQLGRQINQSDIDNLKKIFPSLDSRELRLVVATAQTDYWGKVSRNAFTLRTDSSIGTLYHEVWHEFSQWYLSKDVKDSLYKKVEQITKITDRREQEEFLAEQFSRYKLGESIDPKLASYFKRKGNIFQRILDAIKAIFSNQTNLFREFKRLGLVIDGKEKLKIYSEDFVEFDTLNKAIEKVETEKDEDGNDKLDENGKPITKSTLLFTNTQMINIVHLVDSIIFSVIEKAFKSNKDNEGKTYYSANSGFSPDYITSDAIKTNQFSAIRKAVKQTIDNLNKDYDYEDYDYSTFADNFDLVFNEYVKQTQLPIKNVGGLKIDDDGNIIEEENIEGTRNKANFLEGNESTILADMDKSLRAIFSSLRVPLKKFTKDEYEQSKTDEDLRYELYKEVELANYFQRVDVSQTVIKVFSMIQGLNTYERMLEKIEENAYDNPEFWELLDKLPKIEEVEQGSYKAKDMATKFEASKRYFLPFYNSFVDINTEKTKNELQVKVNSSMVEAERNNIETIKVSNATSFEQEDRKVIFNGIEFNNLEDLYNNKDFFDVTTHSKLTIEGENMKSLTYQQTKKTKDLPLEKMLILLEMSGISLSEKTIDHLSKPGKDRSFIFDNFDKLFFNKWAGFKKLNSLKNTYKETYDKVKDTTLLTTPNATELIDGKKVKLKDIETRLNTMSDKVPFKRLLNSFGLGLNAEYETLNRLFNIEAKFNTQQVTTVVKNANGDLVNTLFMYNGIAQMLTAINDDRYNSIEEITEVYPYMSFLNNFISDEKTLLTDNHYLKAIFKPNGERIKDAEGNIKKIEWNNIGGHVTKINGQSVDEDNSTKLTEIDKIIQNLVMDRYGERLTRPGDKSTETFFTVPDLKYFDLEGAKKQIISYLLNEVNYAYKTLGKDFVLKEFDYLNKSIKPLINNIKDEVTLDDVLENIENNSKIWQEIKDFIQIDIDDYLKKLRNFGLTDNDLANKLLTVENVSGSSIEKLIEKFIVKKYLNSIAQGNLFYGYTGLYTDKFKRNSHIYSTGTMLSISPSVLTGINKNKLFSYAYIQEKRKNPEFNKGYEKILNSKLSDVDKKEALEKYIKDNNTDDIIDKYLIDVKNPTYEIEYVEPSEYVKVSNQHASIQASAIESNKTSIANLELDEDAYLKNNSADAQAWCSFDFYKTFKELIGKWSPEQDYLHSMLSLGINVKEFNGKPIHTFFPPIKPQYAGYVPSDNKFFSEHAFDKMSFLPYIPFVYEGRPFEEVGKDMASKNLAYKLTRDAAKVGNNTKRYFAFLKEQVNIEAHDHLTSVFPTQLRQIISGFSQNENGSWLEGFKEMVDNYDKYSAQLRTILEADLNKELGLDLDGEGEVNKSKLKDLLDKELASRQFSTPIINSVEIIDGKFVYDLEAVIAKQTITGLITSIVNRRLVRVQVNGDMLVQISSHYLTNESLLFYKIGTINGKRQTLPATVKVGLRGQWAKLLNFKDAQGKKIGTRERLNDLLKEVRRKLVVAATDKPEEFTEWELDFMKSTQMTAVRIPTQGLNSMEVFQIEEFLDDKVGGLIVVPEEITTKAGSDFDIDKLVMMYPEFIKNSYGKGDTNFITSEEFKELEIKLQPYFKLKAELNKVDKALSDSDVNYYLKTEKRKLDEFYDADSINKLYNFNENVLESNLDLANLADDLENQIEQLNITEKDLSNFNNYINRKKIIHNNLQNSIKELTLHPTRYIELVYPNGTDKIGSGALSIGKGVNEKPELDLSVNKLEIKRYWELLNQGVFKRSDFEVNGEFNIEKFLLFVLNDRKDNLNTANGKANTQKAEDAKFINGLGTKGLVGISALQVTMINLISNFNVGIKTSFNRSEKSDKKTKLPTIYYTSEYKKNIKNEILEFTVKTDNFPIREFKIEGNELKTKKKETKKYLKRTLAEQMVNPMVDSLNDKNPISQININAETLSTVSFMTTYLGITSEIAYYLVNQPLVLDHIRNKQINRSKFLNEYKKLFEKEKEPTGWGLIKHVLEMRGIPENEISQHLDSLREGTYARFNTDETDDSNDISNMFENIGKNIKDLAQDDKKMRQQLQHLANFTTFEDLSEEYRKLNSATNWSTNTQNSYFAAQEKLRELDEIKKRAIFTNIDKIENESVVSNFKVQDKISNILREMFDITTNPEFTNYALFFGKMIRSDSKDRFFRLLSNDFFNFILNNYVDGIDDLSRELFVNKVYSPNGLTHTGVLDQLKELKTNEDFQDNMFVQWLEILDDGITRNIRVRVPNKEISTGEAVTEGITKLVEYFDNEGSDFGRKIVMLGLLQDGVNKSNISWSNYIDPSLYETEIRLANNKFRAYKSDVKTNILSTYIALFFKNNPSILSSGLEETVFIKGTEYEDSYEERNIKIVNLFKSAGLTLVEPRVSPYKFKNYKIHTPENPSRLNIDVSADRAKGGTYNRKFILDKLKDFVNIEVYESNRNKYIGTIQSLKDNQVFVFGSNKVGINGNLENNSGGAALVALRNKWVEQGEKMINKFSKSGKSYGLVTVEAPKKFLQKSEIISNIKQLYKTSIENLDKEFLIAYDGALPNKKNLNGFTNREMAKMFATFEVPSNIVFEEKFDSLVEEQTRINKNLNNLKKVNETLELKPSFTLSEEQLEAIDKTVEFIKKGNSNEYYVIQGKAGVGKSTVIKSIAKQFKNKVMIGAALSNQAKSVISNTFKDENIPISFHSIAGLLGFKLNIETGQFEEDTFAKAAIENADIVFVDEASMINEQMLELIMTKKPSKAKIIFLGDIGQLPPIRTKDNPYYKDKEDLFNLKSPIFNNKNKSFLTTRFRQGEENPILPFADYFWENSQVKNPVANPAKIRENKITEKGALLFTNTFKDIENSVISSFKTAIVDKNPNHIKVVTYKNSTRKSINTIIHNAIFGLNSPQFVNGELVTFNDEYNGIENSYNTQVLDVSDTKEFKGIKYVNLTVTYLGDKKVVPVVINEDLDKFNKLVSNSFAIAKSKKGSESYGSLMREAWDLKKYFANVDYGYAISSHKSQGSTYDIVIVDEKDIRSVSPIDNKTKSESIYTALTRSRDVAIVISSEKVDDVDFGTDISLKGLQKLTDSNITESSETSTELPKPTTSKDLLESIKDNSPYKELINDLLKLESVKVEYQDNIISSYDTDKFSYGKYDPNTNTIILSNTHKLFQKGRDASDQVLIHEYIHFLTYNKLRTDSKFKSDIEKIYNYTKENITDADKFYPFKNLDEFIVGAFTDSGLIDKLRSLPSLENTKSSNLFRDFLNLILKAVGIKDSLLEQVYNIVGNSLDVPQRDIDKDGFMIYDSEKDIPFFEIQDKEQIGLSELLNNGGSATEKKC